MTQVHNATPRTEPPSSTAVQADRRAVQPTGPDVDVQWYLALCDTLSMYTAGLSSLLLSLLLLLFLLHASCLPKPAQMPNRLGCTMMTLALDKRRSVSRKFDRLISVRTRRSHLSATACSAAVRPGLRVPVRQFHYALPGAGPVILQIHSSLLHVLVSVQGRRPCGFRH